MADLIPQQMLPMARFRYPNTWKLTDVAGASPQNDEVVATGVASKHNVIGYLIVCNKGIGLVTIKFAWESGSDFMEVSAPAHGVTVHNLLGIEPVSATADKDLLADVTSSETISVAITCGYFEVPT